MPKVSGKKIVIVTIMIVQMMKVMTTETPVFSQRVMI